MGRRRKQPVVAIVVVAGLFFMACCSGPCALFFGSHDRAKERGTTQPLASVSLPASQPQQSNTPVTSNVTTAQPPLSRNPAPTSVPTTEKTSSSHPPTPIAPKVERPTPPPIAEPDISTRQWTSGQFKTNGSFVSFQDGIVKLRKEAGGTADIPIEKLSTDDQQYIKKLIRTDATEIIMVAKVVEVIDGDTITVLEEGKQVRVRLLGIDAPEIGQTFGDKSKQYLSDRLLGRTPLIEWHERDQEQLVHGKIYLDGEFVNLQAIGDGFAWHDKVASSDVRMRNAELVARAGRRGLWSNPMPAPPWEYRTFKKQ